MRRVLWLTVSFLMMLSLVIAACAPATVPTAPATPTTPTTPATPAAPAAPAAPVTKKPQQEAVKAVGEAPKYGGWLNLGVASDSSNWAGTVGGGGFGVSFNMPFDFLWDADWAKGNAGGYGTKETDWSINHDRYDFYTAAVATNWDWKIDPQTDKVKIVVSIRQGVRFHQSNSEASRRVGGRELTADDVVWNLTYGAVQRTWPASYPEIRDGKVTKTGPWEVTVEFTGSQVARQVLNSVMTITLRPPELVKKYDDYDNWRLVVATGPFMLTEVVPGSSYTYVRNPSWWNRDPVGPGKGNQLPYIDGLKQFVLPDVSTRYAALRVGKVDMLQDFSPEDAKQMRKTAPRLKEYEYMAWGARNPSLMMRVDMPPFNDIRVRHAMMRATDFEAIRQGLFEGKGIINTFPFTFSPLYKDLYWAHDDPELPEKIKELYIYNPEKAKQLLKEAGYPNGLKVQILVRTTNTDYVSIFKDMWQKVGVEIDFMVRESVVRDRMVIEAQHPPMVVAWSASLSSFATRVSDLSAGNWRAGSVIKPGDDPVLEAAWEELGKLVLKDYMGAMRRMRGILKDYILYQAYAIPAPDAPVSAFWGPWVKGYSGEVITLSGRYYRWAAWVWIDQELKKKMGY